MGSVDHSYMRKYLSQSLSSVNRNKINGLLAEIEFRNYLIAIGHSDRVSVGGWIARNTDTNYGHNTVAVFPEIISVEKDYPPTRNPSPPLGLHTICATFHQIGIRSYYAFPVVDELNNIEWKFKQLGLPVDKGIVDRQEVLDGFKVRERKYNFLRYNQDVEDIPSSALNEEFSKESLRVFLQQQYLMELSDVDGLLWGERFTYPIEIKEKTPATDNRLGEYFGLDVGPFVKLAFYAAKKGNLHSIFVVREIDDVETRGLVKWWYITFNDMAQYASWTFSSGGRNMQGGASAVVRIPKAEFRELTQRAITTL